MRWWALVVLPACSFPHGNAPSRDGATVDAAVLPVALATWNVASVSGSDHVTFSLTIPQGPDRLLLVAVQLGVTCPSEQAPAVISVTYDGAPLVRVTSIVGTPCGTTTTRSEQWQLIAPATGTHDVTVVLAAAAHSAHSGALAFTGVDPTTPISASATASGTGTSSQVAIVSAPGELVVNTVGQGTSIVAPGADQTACFVHNVDSSNTLNNSAASTAPGASSVNMTWSFGASDEWQTISSSLRPAS